jgi:tRNA threonylcarbamoyladenosine biosynthesis protein TsaE
MDIVFKLNTIDSVAKQFWQQAGNATVFAFHGEMGSGKTTFIHALCAEKKVKDVVASPTFSIINHYKFKRNSNEENEDIYHMDLYRLEGQEEAIQAGVEDVLLSGSICLVEWPERAPNLFPEHSVHTYLEVVDDQIRRLKTEGI